VGLSRCASDVGMDLTGDISYIHTTPRASRKMPRWLDLVQGRRLNTHGSRNQGTLTEKEVPHAYRRGDYNYPAM
jgi:hypothetical protein